jgi:RimJ/RimL family protein N-acetyltransferase
MMATDLHIPVLETPRLILRANKFEDFDSMVAIWTDPIVRRHFHGPALTREDLWSRFLRSFGMWAVMGYGAWAVEEKETASYIGTVGTFEVKRDIDPPLEDMPEAGWTLAPRVHGKGYATEAALAALAWTDAHLNYPPMFCIIAPENVPSIRVAEKCGFRPWRETVYKDEPTLIFLREPAASESV